MTGIRARLVDALTEALRGNLPLADHLTDVLLALDDITIAETAVLQQEMKAAVESAIAIVSAGASQRVNQSGG